MVNKDIYIAVIDDDDNATELLEYNFGRLGFNTLCFNDPMVAKKYLTTNKVDAIVTDWMMPNLDGIDLVEVLMDSVNKDTPKLMVSCIENPESIKKAQLSGIDHYMPKPVKSRDLCIAVQHLLNS